MNEQNVGLKNLAILVKSIMGGLAICIGATSYLAIGNALVGALFFTIGIFTIYVFDFNLFTGKVCYIPDEKPKYIIILLIVYLGNMISTVGIGFLLRLTTLESLIPIAQKSVEIKLQDGLFSAFIMSVFCGILMSIAVLGFFRIPSWTGKVFVLAMPVMAFIHAGFQHSIANLFYISLANMWDAKAVLYSIIYALGNTLGAIIIPLSQKFTSKYDKHEQISD